MVEISKEIPVIMEQVVFAPAKLMEKNNQWHMDKNQRRGHEYLVEHRLARVREEPGLPGSHPEEVARLLARTFSLIHKLYAEKSAEPQKKRTRQEPHRRNRLSFSGGEP